MNSNNYKIIYSKYKCSRCGYAPSNKKRSNPQNKYYWGCVVQILSDETGYTKDEIHEIIKYKFLPAQKNFCGKKGKDVKLSYSLSTTELDTKNWEELMAQIREWASIELGIWIASPNEALNEETN